MKNIVCTLSIGSHCSVFDNYNIISFISFNGCHICLISSPATFDKANWEKEITVQLNRYVHNLKNKNKAGR